MPNDPCLPYPSTFTFAPPPLLIPPAGACPQLPPGSAAILSANVSETLSGLVKVHATINVTKVRSKGDACIVFIDRRYNARVLTLLTRILLPAHCSRCGRAPPALPSPHRQRNGRPSSQVSRVCTIFLVVTLYSLRNACGNRVTRSPGTMQASPPVSKISALNSLPPVTHSVAPLMILALELMA